LPEKLKRMKKSHSSKVGELDPDTTTIDFSPEVRGAFRDLAAAAHFNEKFNGDTLLTIQEYAETKKPSVSELLTAFPLIAKDTFEHGGKKAREAWDNLGSELVEHGFTLQKGRTRGK
jgi:hypothetical protein